MESWEGGAPGVEKARLAEGVSISRGMQVVMKCEIYTSCQNFRIKTPSGMSIVTVHGQVPGHTRTHTQRERELC